MAYPPQTDPMAAPLTMSQGGGLEVPLGVKFWRDEVDRAEREDKKHHGDWDQNVQWYIGKAPDFVRNEAAVNVNVDFYQVEMKQAQLFYETPELQITGTGMLRNQTLITAAHRELLKAILGEDHMDVLTPIQRALKDCLCVSGTGPVILGYEPYQRPVQDVHIPGDILGLSQIPPVTICEKFYADHFSPKKFLKPADFHDTDWDKAPWLGMRFRMPMTKARTTFKLPPEFEGQAGRDEHLINADDHSESTDQPYVDGVVIWYRAAFYEEAHPDLYRELVLIDGMEQEARHRDSPHQTILPDGKMSGDSMMGNPIHPLTIRTVPDSSNVPSDSQMTRPLVKELCTFRTQMVQERDANRPWILYDVDALPPDVTAKIENRTIGAMIGVEGGKLAAGVGSIMASAVQGTSPRQTYLANDYIQRDIEKTLAIDATGAGVQDDANETATKTAAVEKNRNVRLDHERRQVLKWYLGLVSKTSALVLRYLTPQTTVAYIGPEASQAWAQLQELVKQGPDQRLAFSAKPDSQIRVDAAQERKFWMDMYQFTAKDPNVVRTKLLEKLFEVAGENPSDFIVQELPESKPDPSLGFSFKGEDVIGPQAAIVLEILAQCGVQISQQAQDQAAGQLFKQMSLGIRDASGQPVPTATKKPAEHGGPADQVRPLSKQSADKTGNRPGPGPKGEA